MTNDNGRLLQGLQSKTSGNTQVKHTGKSLEAQTVRKIKPQHVTNCDGDNRAQEWCLDQAFYGRSDGLDRCALLLRPAQPAMPSYTLTHTHTLAGQGTEKGREKHRDKTKQP